MDVLQKNGLFEIEKIQYKALKTVFNSNESLEDFFLRSNEVSIHQKQLRQLTAKIYKSSTDLSSEFIKPFFTVKELPYNLRDGHMLNLPSTQTTYYGTNLPLSIKQSQSLLELKTNIKTLRNIECLCKICKIS